jgi:hypothetical protein
MEAGYQVELVNGIPGTVYSTTRLPLCTENTTRGHHPDACGQQLVRYTVPGIYSSYLDRRIPAAGVPIE